MTGKTLALYNQIQQDVSRLWDNWLERMDVWEPGLDADPGPRFPRVRGKEANRLLDKLGSFDEVDRACQGCAAGWTSWSRATRRRGRCPPGGGAAGPTPASPSRRWPGCPCRPPPTKPRLAACAALTEQARQLLRPDPICAEAVLADGLRRTGCAG